MPKSVDPSLLSEILRSFSANLNFTSTSNFDINKSDNSPLERFVRKSGVPLVNSANVEINISEILPLPNSLMIGSKAGRDSIPALLKALNPAVNSPLPAYPLMASTALEKTFGISNGDKRPAVPASGLTAGKGTDGGVSPFDIPKVFS